MRNKILFSILVIGTLFSACKKDALESRDLLVYLPGDYGSVTNTFTLPLLHTPLDVSGKTTVKLAAVATREVTADVTLSIVADTSLIDEYNRDNHTKAVALPSAAYRIVNPGTYHIHAGAVISDSMEIEITDPASLNDSNGYLLPLRIEKLDGKDKGVQISTNRGAAFINVTYKFNNIIATEAPPAGTVLDRTGWSVTVSNTTSGALGPAMLDGDNTTAWRSSNSSTAAKWAILNLGASQTMKGLQLTPNYVTTTENPTQVTVSTSTDNVNWVVQGVWTGTRPASGTSAASPDLKGINFIAPVQAQYVRLDINAWVSGNRVGIGEFNVVQ